MTTTKMNGHGSQTHTIERRDTRRSGADAHGVTVARIRPGHIATVIDASVAGALLETSHRLLPGVQVDLYLEGRAHHARVRARVVRCFVTHVSEAALFYRGAVTFDRHVPWLAVSEGYAVPGTEPRGGIRAEPTRPAV